MSEFMPHFAPVVVLLFLGAVLLIGFDSAPPPTKTAR